MFRQGEELKGAPGPDVLSGSVRISVSGPRNRGHWSLEGAVSRQGGQTGGFCSGGGEEQFPAGPQPVLSRALGRVN